MKCSICTKELKVWDTDNNAEPINNGRCCSVCNVTRVIPERIFNRCTQ